MQAAILAGGRGERLMPLTKDIPKPMVLINNRPYLHYQIEFLARQEIRNIVLLVGYLKEKIMGYFGDGSNFGVNIKYSIETEPLGTAGAIKNAEKLLNNVFLVIYGDSFLPIDFYSVWEAFETSKKKALMVVYDNKEDTEVKNNVSLDEDNNVIRYNKNSDEKLDFVEAGVLILRKNILLLIEKNKKASLEEEIFPKLIEKKELVGFKTKQRFYDIGTKERLEKIKEFLE